MPFKRRPQTIDFSPNVFAPFLPTATSELVRLIGEAETLESKRRVDATLNTVIERSDSHVSSFVCSFCHILHAIVDHPIHGHHRGTSSTSLFVSQRLNILLISCTNRDNSRRRLAIERILISHGHKTRRGEPSLLQLARMNGNLKKKKNLGSQE